MKISQLVPILMLTLLFGWQTATAQAKPEPAGPSTVDGKWHFILDTPGGDRDVDADFTVDADGKVSGTWGKSSADGTFKNGMLTLAFEFTSEDAGETSTMKVSGKLDEAGSLAGTWQFSSYDGTFKALRPNPERSSKS